MIELNKNFQFDIIDDNQTVYEYYYFLFLKHQCKPDWMQAYF